MPALTPTQRRRIEHRVRMRQRRAEQWHRPAGSSMSAEEHQAFCEGQRKAMDRQLSSVLRGWETPEPPQEQAKDLAAPSSAKAAASDRPAVRSTSSGTRLLQGSKVRAHGLVSSAAATLARMVGRRPNSS